MILRDEDRVTIGMLDRKVAIFVGWYPDKESLDLADVGKARAFATTGTLENFKVWFWDNEEEVWGSPSGDLQIITDNGNTTTNTIVHAPATLDSESATLGQLNNLNPFGLEGQILKISQNNTNDLVADDVLKIGNYVTTQEQLEDSQSEDGVFISFEEVFTNWKRFSHGGDPNNPDLSVNSNNIPGSPSNTQSWSFNGSQVFSTLNTGSHVGFISENRVLNYRLKATLSAQTTSDNDWIGSVIAFVEDENDLVPNQAYGLDPDEYVGINVTDEFIPNQHTLSLIRGRNLSLSAYALVYNYGKLNQSTIANITGPWLTSSNWNFAEVDIEVVRVGDLITVRTTDFSDAPGGKGELRFDYTFDLVSDPRTQKFRGPARYGFSVRSQPFATFSNIEIEGSGVNEIYDLRNGDIWTVDSENNWVISTRSLWNELLDRSFVYNPRYNLFAYVKEPNKFEIIKPELFQTLQDITDNGNSTTNTIVHAPATTDNESATLGQVKLELEDFTPLPTGDIILNTGFITTDGSNVTIDGSQADREFRARINNVTVTNTTLEVFPITPPSAGLFRRDLISMNSSGAYVITAGTPGSDSEAVLLPNLPANSVALGEISINDTGVTGVLALIAGAYVSYSGPQTLSTIQRQQARTNIESVRRDGSDIIRFSESGSWQFRDADNVTNFIIEQSLQGALRTVSLRVLRGGVTVMNLQTSNPGTGLGIYTPTFLINTESNNGTRTVFTFGYNGAPIFSGTGDGNTRFFLRPPMQPRSGTGDGAAAVVVSEQSSRRDELPLIYQTTITGTGKLNDIDLNVINFSLRFGSGVTEVSGIDAKGDSKIIWVTTENTSGLWLNAQDTDSIAANRFLNAIYVPFREYVPIIYQTTGSLNRWVRADSNRDTVAQTVNRMFTPITRTGTSKQSVLTPQFGAKTLAPRDMAVGSSYTGKLVANFTWDSGNDYSLFLNLGGQEVTVLVETSGSGTNLQGVLKFDIDFNSGADNARVFRFSGVFQRISSSGSPEDIPIPSTDLTIDATVARDFDILFQGANATNSITTIKAELVRNG